MKLMRNLATVVGFTHRGRPRTQALIDPIMTPSSPEAFPDAPTRILFVCLGNICRSPLAAGVFRHLADAAGADDLFEVESAGTGAWHVGEPPDLRSQHVARKHGIELRGRARRVTPDDLTAFDLVVAMDRENLTRLESLRDPRGAPARLHLLREFDPEAHGDLEVPDPYYGGPNGFDHVYDMIERSCRVLLENLLEGGRTS